MSATRVAAPTLTLDPARPARDIVGVAPGDAAGAVPADGAVEGDDA
jgi:hypothetical protein